ncbi:hypothetical protein AGMMS49944_19040 [Spirochaetia bacterium]|nr:hypothetical protein AGMMS49944_19040 [Spirochaetia bacterium]
MLDINSTAKNEISLKVHGRIVKFSEYESVPEGDFIKICTYDHDLGVAGEYALIRNKYPGCRRVKQKLTRVMLNGTIIKCDILTIKISDERTRDIYFDISQMMEDLENKISGKTNKAHWDSKATLIYDKLVHEMNYIIADGDEECLSKKINESVRIVFDVKYFFGLIINLDETPEELWGKYNHIMKKYINEGFICKGAIKEHIQNWYVKGIMCGYIQIDNFTDINIVFDNYKRLEEEVLGIV